MRDKSWCAVVAEPRGNSNLLTGALRFVFWFGKRSHEYIDMLPSYSFQDRETELDILGGTADGISVHPMSGNRIVVRLKGVR